MSAALEVRHLACEVRTPRGWQPAVEPVSFRLEAGQTVGLVGESGCGKTLTALAILGLLPEGARRVGGEIWLEGALRDASALAAARGKSISMVFQEPLSALDPVQRVGAQIAYGLSHHGHLPRGAARAAAVELLREMGVDEPGVRAEAYPHQLSGGMRQRALLAAALAAGPRVLVADEPTTALDVTVQAQVLALLRRLVSGRGLGLLLITHDLGVVAELCDRVLVMYSGGIVESAPAQALFDSPLHPYTRALLDARPDVLARGRPLVVLQGGVPAPGAWPDGCRFRERCRRASAACATAPALLPATDGDRAVACHHPEARA